MKQNSTIKYWLLEFVARYAISFYKCSRVTVVKIYIMFEIYIVSIYSFLYIQNF